MIIKKYIPPEIRNFFAGGGRASVSQNNKFFQGFCFLKYKKFWRPHHKIGEVGAKKYFTDHRTANKIQLVVAIKGNFSGLFFF